MAVIKWKESYETTIISLDREHQRLVEQINLLYTAIREKRTAEVMLSIFDELVDYTRQHFQHEEEMLEKYNYPGLELQREQHQQLAAEVVQYRDKLIAGEELSATEVMGFLRNWLLQHIVEHDLQYGPYLESRGGRFLT